MSTLLFERSLPRFAAARVASAFGSGRGAGVGPLRLVERDAPAVPAAGWVHVDPILSGICGSDLATLDGRSSRYFEDIVSFPFVPGHEVVGTVAEDATGALGGLLAAGRAGAARSTNRNGPTPAPRPDPKDETTRAAAKRGSDRSNSSVLTCP